MKLSKEARKISHELFRASFQDGRLDPERVRIIARKVAESKPRHYMDILHAYERLIRLDEEKRQARVESAVAMDDSTRQGVESSLRAKYGNDVTVEFKVVPELIGGLRVKIGSDVYDSSVRERLRRLEAQALHA